MHLKILLPTEIFADESDVRSIVAETGGGSYGLLEHRLDCAAALRPGILTYTTDHETVYLAVDEGVMVKTGSEVLVSVRHAIGGTDLSRLHDEIKRRFLTLDREERMVRDMVAKMESGFAGRFAEFKHGH
jgi:F-type H+-transporting ATPase subunit epsilon